MREVQPESEWAKFWEPVTPRPRRGRPRCSQSQEPIRELLRLLANGRQLRYAAHEARIDPERLLGLLYADPSFRRVVTALLDDRLTLSGHE